MNAALKLQDPPADLFPEFPSSYAPPSGQLKALEKPLHEVAPGVWAGGMPVFEMPSHVICRIVPIAGQPGAFTLQPDSSYPGYIRMTDDIGKRLGVIGLSATTMRRLLWAGFVDHIRTAPGCIYISLESLLEHFKRTENDCARERSYWTAERVETWRATLEGESNLES